MKNEMPKISVIMATFNSAATLQRALDSYASQDYPNKELIVIDGASKDETVNIIKKNESFIDYWISEPDAGVYEAWNKGLDHVTGEWIQFLGSDDYFTSPDVLSRMAERLRSSGPEYNMAYAPIIYVNRTGDPLVLAGAPWHTARRNLRLTLPTPHPGVFHRWSLFLQHGRFDESFKIVGDYEFLMRELINNVPFYIHDVVAVAQTVGGLSTASNTRVLKLKEMALARRMHGLPPYNWVWIKEFVYYSGIKQLQWFHRQLPFSLIKRRLNERLRSYLPRLFRTPN